MARNGSGTAAIDQTSASPLDNPKSESDYEAAMKEQFQSIAQADAATMKLDGDPGAIAVAVGEERDVGVDPLAPKFASVAEAAAVKPDDPKFTYARAWLAAEMRLRQIRPQPERPLRTFQVDGHPTLVQARSDIEALAKHNDATGKTHLSPASRRVREVKVTTTSAHPITNEQIMREMLGTQFVG